MIEIEISNTIKTLLPELRLGCLHALVTIAPSSAEQIEYTRKIILDVQELLSIEEVSKSEIIHATKEAYRKLGKDPSRYRPSAEALTRRIVQGKGLYHVNNVVDVLNCVSIQTGFSIGGYDTNLLKEPIIVSKGEANEPYEAIGRGKLNIENLPVLRDSKGAFGSPTSDSLRSCVNDKTTSFLMVIFDFTGSQKLYSTMEESVNLFKKFCGINEAELKVIT